jgi:hypothetical protein
VPDDRFGDRDPSGARRQRSADGRAEREAPGQGSAADRLSELDAREAPPPSQEVPPPARPGSRYAWLVGVAALIALGVAAYNSLVNVGAGEGVGGPKPGRVVPDFAAPSVISGTDADANVFQAPGAAEDQAGVPACEVKGEDVVNICDLRQGPTVLTFVALGDLSDEVRCEDALDQVERVRSEFPQVTFVGVISGASREEVADILPQHEWRFPVALDQDSAVFNLYRVGDCPTTVLAEPGGEVIETMNGLLTDEELSAAARRVAADGAGKRT